MRPDLRLLLVLPLALAAALAFAGEKAPKLPKTSPLSDEGRANVSLAEGYLEAGRLDLAAQYASAALRSDAGSGTVHATVAMVRARQNQPEQAQQEFGRALALSPGDGAILNAYGAWLCERGDHDGADNAFRSAIADPRYDSLVALVNAGRCALMAQQWSKGDGYLRRAAQIAPTNRGVLLMLAEAQLRLQRPLEARAFVQRSDSLGADVATLKLAVRVEEAAGDAAAATRYRNRLRDEFPQVAPTGEGAAKP
jgi:type IV pilus assembly protein PilF